MERRATDDDEARTLCVWIVEDKVALRTQLARFVDGTEGMQCPHTFGDFEALQQAFGRLRDDDRPDIVLLDIELPGKSGIDGIPWLREKLLDVPIVMLTIHDDEERIFAALRRGATGYLLKAMPLDDVVDGIRQAVRRGMLMPPAVAEKVRQAFQPPPDLASFGLTARQIEVLEYLRRGYSQQQIADALFISVNTVNRHQQDVYRKLGVHSAGEAVARVFPERGL